VYQNLIEFHMNNLELKCMEIKKYLPMFYDSISDNQFISNFHLPLLRKCIKLNYNKGPNKDVHGESNLQWSFPPSFLYFPCPLEPVYNKNKNSKHQYRFYKRSRLFGLGVY